MQVRVFQSPGHLCLFCRTRCNTILYFILAIRQDSKLLYYTLLMILIILNSIRLLLLSLALHSRSGLNGFDDFLQVFSCQAIFETNINQRRERHRHWSFWRPRE